MKKFIVVLLCLITFFSFGQNEKNYGISAPELFPKTKSASVPKVEKLLPEKSATGVVVLDFEGLGDNDPVNEFYNGGTSGFGNSGVDNGISFTSDALAIIDGDDGGTGNFANEPSPSTIMFFLGSDPILNVPLGFGTGFSFFYCTSEPGIISVYDDLNGTGNLLGTVTLTPNYGIGVGDPTGDFALWSPLSIAISGVGKSIVFSGVANQCGFDDITFGSLNPGVQECANMVVDNDEGICGAVVEYTVPSPEGAEVSQVDGTGLSSGSVFPVGVTNQEYLIDYGDEITETCAFTVTVNDAEPPAAVCQDITVELDENGNATITAYDVNGGSTDNCGIASIAIDKEVFNCEMVGDNDVVLTVTDVNGLVSTCTAVVTVEDNIAPLVDCTGGEMGKAAYVRSNVGRPWGSTSNEQAMDLVFGAGNWDELYYETLDPSVLLSGAYDFIYMEGGADNANQMEAFVDANITDMEVWVHDGGNLFLNAAPWSSTGNDGMNWGFGGVELKYVPEESLIGTFIRQVEATDPFHPIFNGPNTPIATQYSGNYYAHAIIPEEAYLNVLINDLDDVNKHVLSSIMWGSGKVFFGGMTTTNFHSPGVEAFNLRANMFDYLGHNTPMQYSLDVNGEVSITVEDIETESSDNCGIESKELDVYDFDCDDLGNQTVTLTVTDVNGNASSCQSVITIVDDMAPDVTANPLTVELYENGEYVLTEMDIIAMAEGTVDNCTPFDQLKLDVFPKSFECIHVGEEVNVKVTAVDAEGNSASRWTTVVVKDVTAPEAKCQNIEVVLDEKGKVVIYQGLINPGNVHTSIPEWARTYNYLETGSIDECGIELITLDKYEFTCADLGENIVTLTATDPSGNKGTCEATVTVVDETMPVLLCQDAELVLDENGKAVPTEELLVIEASEICGDVEVVFSPAELDCSMLGENEVTVTAIDESGNEATCVATVTVVDTTQPVIAQVENIEVVVEPGVCEVALENYPEVLATDNCEALATMSSGLGSAGLYPLGTSTETWEAVDASGNSTSMSFTVTVTTTNDLPVVDAVPDQLLVKDSGNVELILTGISSGIDCEEQVVESITVSSSDETIVKAMVSYVAGEETATVTLSPMENMGVAEITVLVQDNGDAENTSEMKFAVEVVANKVATDVWNVDNNLDVALYPNPTSNKVNIEINSNVNTDVDVVVFNMVGQQIIHKSYSAGEIISFNMGEHISGMYFVKLDVDGKQIVKKLVVDRR